MAQLDVNKAWLDYARVSTDEMSKPATEADLATLSFPVDLVI